MKILPKIAYAHQDSWFTASSLHAVIETLDPKPELVIIMSDNRMDIFGSRRSKNHNRFSSCIDTITASFNVIVEKVIKGIKGTFVANLNPIRNKPTTGEFSECIKAQNIPGIVKELKKRNIRFDNKENKNQLINLLKNQLAEDMKKAKIAGNINKSDRYTAQNMHNKLVQHAQEGEFKVEEVPKVATIQTEFIITQEHKQEAAARKSN
ncbi:hypothetical protein C2G38_2196564 [Gigaspora rosea]|uniref:Uncharacterized protein n=1 Tax=Gigaspora rosea TaxID=44941 RepID=A0A397UUH2_9GLOM|nr:hypothetical protein C2G38_2196564 [Gigaspora rosea]